jgi:hypothetical protein
VTGVTRGQQQFDLVAGTHQQLVDQQVGGLVHPVAEGAAGQLGALAGFQVVVGDQRVAAVLPDALPEGLADQQAHGG